MQNFKHQKAKCAEIKIIHVWVVGPSGRSFLEFSLIVKRVEETRWVLNWTVRKSGRLRDHLG